ncbi:MAG TPA: hypothetical protein VGP70_19250 [Actinomadura sp.]|nr:hypothetical protein [Actinomadura sp.]
MLAIGGAGDFAQRHVEYQAQLPAGSTMVRGGSEGQTARVRQAIRQELPGVPITELSAIAGMSQCHGHPARGGLTTGPGALGASACPYGVVEAFQAGD